MGVTNLRAGTRIDEIADSIYRISTVVADGAFCHNQYLIRDDEPLLFHTGARRMAPLVIEAVTTVMPFSRLRYLAFSHFESDECGAVDALLAAAPAATPLCGHINVMINGDAFARAPRGLADAELLSLANHRVRWLDAPHLPHGWECGYLFEEVTRTLFCGDLFTQPGGGLPPLTSGDILGPSEAFRRRIDYYSHTTQAKQLVGKLAATGPTTLACMHGSAWQGDGTQLLHELGEALSQGPAS